MLTRTLLVSSALLCLCPAIAGAEITYPAGTTIEEAWLSPPRIDRDAAIAVLAGRLLERHDPGVEIELGPEDFEALKHLVGKHAHSVEEDPVRPGTRRYGGEITPENMTAAEDSFFAGLALAIVERLGLATVAPEDACVAEKRLWETTKYKYDLGWNEVEVWGITAFGHNVQYGLNQSDVVHGVFPWGIRMSWWGSVRCALDRPKDEAELRACGETKEWKLHGASTIRLTNAYEHAVPGVAQASLTWAGAVASGEADRFSTNAQTRESLDPTWLLGPANTPLPSEVAPSDAPCVACDHGPAVDSTYRFSEVLAWHSNVILNAAHNSLAPRDADAFLYSGRSDGNPHALPTWSLTRTFSRSHEPFPGCL